MTICTFLYSLLISQFSSLVEIEVREFQYDSLQRSSVMLEGYGVENDPFLNPDDEVSWLAASFPIAKVDGYLYLVSDRYSLGIELLKSKAGGLDGFDVSKYQLAARFPTGIWLPINRFAVRGEFAVFEIAESDLIIQDLDYCINSRVGDTEYIYPGDEVIVAGPSVGSGSSLIRTHITSIPGQYRLGGIYNFSSRIRINSGGLSEYYIGSPVYLMLDDRAILLGTLSVFGPEAENFAYVCLAPTVSTWTDAYYQWYTADAEGLSSYIEDEDDD